MAAAGVSKAGKLGAVGAMNIPPVERVFKAFVLGAKAVRPNIQIIPPVYTGSWDDPVKAKEQTLTLLNQGADIIVQDVDAAAVGVFNAVKEKSSPDKPLYALGTNSDQNAVVEGVVLASAPIYYDKTLIDLAKKVKAGGYTPSANPFGMKEGAIGYVANPALEPKIPADIKAKIEAAQKAILEGKLDVLKGS
jgi:basic membrane lipoprotein Med (substrate-binding protein (PBP1-ABC) superfamily)